jgi:hypothetical protein
MYVSKNPTNWKKKEVKRLIAKIKAEPDGRSSIIMSDPRSNPDGACTVVSQ